MIDLLNEQRFDFVAQDEKRFIFTFDDAMTKLGYTFGNNIGSGYCWGRYMLIYRKAGGKSKNVFARIYIRDEDIVLRLFLNAIDKHRGYIENSPSHIKEVFVGDHGKCKRCHNNKDGVCRFRKTYTIDGQLIEKCNGITFEFLNPSIQKLSDYVSLFTEFYPNRKR
jgi:hypothetical protein